MKKTLLILLGVSLIGFVANKPSFSQKATPQESGGLSPSSDVQILGPVEARKMAAKIKEGHPDKSINVNEVKGGVRAKNLKDALDISLILKGSNEADSCAAKRDLLSQVASDCAPLCGTAFNGISEDASCETVDGLLAYFGDIMFSGACTVECSFYYYNGGFGHCGCTGPYCIFVQ